MLFVPLLTRKGNFGNVFDFLHFNVLHNHNEHIVKRKIIIALLLFACVASLPAIANNDKKAIRDRVASMTAEQKENRAAEIKVRVAEIQSMNKSVLSVDERKSLRRELHDINTEAKVLNDGKNYISLAGVIAVIVVLIIVL